MLSSALVHRSTPSQHYHRGRASVAGAISISDQTTALGWIAGDQISKMDSLNSRQWCGRNSQTDTSSARFDLNMLRNFIRHNWQEFNLLFDAQHWGGHSILSHIRCLKKEKMAERCMRKPACEVSVLAECAHLCCRSTPCLRSLCSQSQTRRWSSPPPKTHLWPGAHSPRRRTPPPLPPGHPPEDLREQAHICTQRHTHTDTQGRCSAISSHPSGFQESKSCFRCCNNTNSKHCATLRGLSAVCIRVQRFAQAKDKATPINTIILPPCFTSVFPLFLLKKIPLRLFFPEKQADMQPRWALMLILLPAKQNLTQMERGKERRGARRKKFLSRLFTQASAWEEERKYFY